MDRPGRGVPPRGHVTLPGAGRKAGGGQAGSCIIFKSIHFPAASPAAAAAAAAARRRQRASERRSPQQPEAPRASPSTRPAPPPWLPRTMGCFYLPGWLAVSSAGSPRPRLPPRAGAPGLSLRGRPGPRPAAWAGSPPARDPAAGRRAGERAQRRPGADPRPVPPRLLPPTCTRWQRALRPRRHPRSAGACGRGAPRGSGPERHLLGGPRRGADRATRALRSAPGANARSASGQPAAVLWARGGGEGVGQDGPPLGRGGGSR